MNELFFVINANEKHRLFIKNMHYLVAHLQMSNTCTASYAHPEMCNEPDEPNLEFILYNCFLIRIILDENSAFFALDHPRESSSLPDRTFWMYDLCQISPSASCRCKFESGFCFDRIYKKTRGNREENRMFVQSPFNDPFHCGANFKPKNAVLNIFYWSRLFRGSGCIFPDWQLKIISDYYFRCVHFGNEKSFKKLRSLSLEIEKILDLVPDTVYHCIGYLYRCLCFHHLLYFWTYPIM